MFDYTKSMQKLQSLHTSKMASELDGKLINFYDKQKNSANAIWKFIKQIVRINTNAIAKEVINCKKEHIKLIIIKKYNK